MGADTGLALLKCTRPKDCSEHALMQSMGPKVAADHDIFQGGHIREEPNILKGSCNAGLGHAMDSSWLIGPALNLKTAAIRRIQARDDIKNVVLPAPFGPISP